MADPVAVVLRPHGRSIDHTPVADVAAGDVVVVGTRAAGAIVGVAHAPIAAGYLGALDIDGIVTFPSADDEAIAAGADCWWNATDGVATAVDDGEMPYLGKAVAASALTATTVDVLRIQATPEAYEGS